MTMSAFIRSFASTAAILMTAAVLTTGPAAAAPGDLAPGTGFKIHKAQLAIKNQDGVPPGCPARKTMMGWVYMSHKATVQIMIVKQGDNPRNPVSITSVKAPNGQYVATYTEQMHIDTVVNAKYRILVGGGQGVVSNWAPLVVNC
jgi:hypothetical protein